MCGSLVYDDIYNSAHTGLYIFYTCVAVSDPLLAVHNYSMWMCSSLHPLIKTENDDNCDLPLLRMQYFGSINNMNLNTFKGAQVWDIPSLGFSCFLHHKVFMGRWFGGKNINLLF